MSTRANDAELHEDARGTEDAAQREREQKAPGGRAARAGAQGAGRAEGGGFARREGGLSPPPQRGLRAHLPAPGLGPAHGVGPVAAPPTRLA